MDVSWRQRWVPLLGRVHDLSMAAVSLPLALWLRLEGLGRGGLQLRDFAEATVMYTAIAGVVFLIRPSRAMWRYVSPGDLVGLVRNVTIAEFLFLAATVMTGVPAWLPRSVYVIQWLVLVALLTGTRLTWRLIQEGQLGLAPRLATDRVPTLLAGSGHAAEAFIRAVQRDRQFGFQVVGLLESDPGRVGLEIHGIPVFGTLDADLSAVVRALDAQGQRPRKLLVATGRVEGTLTRQLVEAAEALGLAVARVADPTELRSGQAPTLSVQPIAVEDLLNRPQAALSRDQMRAFVTGKRVLVTGAGGSIGSELVRQVCGFQPARIVLAELSEHNLYQIDHELADVWPELPRVPVLCDVRDAAQLDRLFDAHRPDVVFHAAALKHVPMVEHNPCEGVLTNVLGSRQVADACVVHGVGTMVMISTDKAVNPANVMGATKRLAETYCQALDLDQAARGLVGTRFVTVRFGNVLGSSGSVVPLFQRQLAQGGPLTVTHPDIERYFMTIREAVQLVLQAAALPVEEARHGDLFVLDMGEPVKIADLARQMIKLAGFEPGVDVEIRYVGLRPGEKLTEELFYDLEELVPTSVPTIRRASPPAIERAVLARELDRLVDVARQGDVVVLRARIKALVPGFTGEG